MKFIRRTTKDSFLENQTISIGAGGGIDTVENLPKLPDEALEIELDDGSTYVVLAYKRK